MLKRLESDKEIADTLVVDKNLTKKIYGSFTTMSRGIMFDLVFLHFLLFYVSL